jgi:hypothetical protein
VRFSPSCISRSRHFGVKWEFVECEGGKDAGARSARVGERITVPLLQGSVIRAGSCYPVLGLHHTGITMWKATST